MHAKISCAQTEDSKTASASSALQKKAVAAAGMAEEFHNPEGYMAHGDGFGSQRQTPWQRSSDAGEVLQAWRKDPKRWANVVLDRKLPAVAARTASLPSDLHPKVMLALKRRNITELYTHQVDALAAASQGKHVVVATPTASGKSLCYNLPVLQALGADPHARALYLFPTKALSRDQEHGLRNLLEDADFAHGVVTYDGDTPGDARRSARERSGILVTNPDMLHVGILPHHTSWAHFFSNLKYVVLDELHMYRGLHGSHLANVMRRLRRIARFYGANPTFIFASATIGNPKAHASAMLGEAVFEVAVSGAPQGARQLLWVNPKVVNKSLGVRRNMLKTVVDVARPLVKAKVPTLIFAQSRNKVEVLVKYLRDAMAGDPTLDANWVQGYRGGYLPKTRRAIEEGLRLGKVQCVVATSALELGIDIGGLDAVICAGYPGSIAALWQRFGRAGRRQDLSLAIWVASSAPLDQYFANTPEALLGAGIEEARLDADNVEVFLRHLKCAAFELPFAKGDGFGTVSPESVGDALDFLADHDIVHPVVSPAGETIYHWASDVYPAHEVSLRNMGWDNFVIVNLATNKTLAEMDYRSAHTMLHEQAIYQHDGGQYQVETLDFENHKAFVRRVAPDYYTTAMTHLKVGLLDVDQRTQDADVETGLGDVSVVEKVVGYKKIKYHSHENVGFGDVHLPEMQMHTTAVWWTFSPESLADLPAPLPGILDALRGLGHALHLLAAIGLMVDPRDLGRTLVEAPERGGGGVDQGDTADVADAAVALAEQKTNQIGFAPTLFLFDRFPGGMGLATRLYEKRSVLWQQAKDMLQRCVCNDGCPSCIGPKIGSTQPYARSKKKTALSRKALLLALLERCDGGATGDG